MTIPSLDHTLDTLQARWRRSRRWRATLAVGVIVSATALTLLAIDVAFQPDRPTRVTLLVAAAVTAIVLLARRRRSPAPTRDDVARWLARSNRVDDDVVRSAAAFAHDPEPTEAEALRQRARLEAESAIETLPRPRVPRALWCGVLGVAAIVLTWVAVDRPTVRRGVERTLLLRDVAYPTATRLTLRGHDPMRPIEVPRGQRLRLIAAVDGRSVDAVTLHRTWPDRTTRSPMKRDVNGDFTAEIGPVHEAQSIFLTGGDDLDARPRYRITVLHPPSVTTLDATAHPPAYTRLDPQPLSDAAWRMPDGSRVVLTVDTDRTVERADLVLFDEAGQRTVRPLEARAPTRFRGALVVSRATRYAIELRDARGLDNRPAPTHRIELVPDTPPRIRLRAPGLMGFVTPNAVLTVTADLRDDYGIRDAAVRVYPRGAEDRGDKTPCPEGASAPLTIALRDRRIRGAVGPRPPEAGDRLALRVEATDARDQRGRSNALQLTVAPPRVVEARLLAAVREVTAVIRETADAIEHAGRQAKPAHRALDWTALLRRTTERLGTLGAAYEINRLPGEDGRHLAQASKSIGEGIAALARSADNDAAPDRPAMASAAAALRDAERVLTRFAGFRDAVRHTVVAAETQARVDLALETLADEAKAAARGPLLARANERFANVRRTMTLAALALDALASRPASPLDPPPARLAGWAKELRGPAVDRLVRGLADALTVAQVDRAREPSRQLALHLRRLAAEMAEVGAAARRAGRARTDADPRNDLGRAMNDLVKRTEAFTRDLKEAARRRQARRAADLERLKEESARLEKALEQAGGASAEDEAGVEKAHPESMQEMMERVRNRINQDDTRGAVAMSEKLLDRLRNEQARRDSSRRRPTPGERQDARPPDPDGQSMGGDYRPETGVAGAERVVAPARIKARSRLRWGVLPPAHGGGTAGALPTEAPARYRDAIHRYYERLSKEQR